MGARPQVIDLRPATRDEANVLIRRWHRHHPPVKSHRFAIAAEISDEVVGVVIVANPVARLLNDGRTFEVVRLCIDPASPRNVASRLLGAARRASAAMGVRRLVSYLRSDERGGSYVAAGWEPIADVKAEAWGSAQPPK